MYVSERMPLQVFRSGMHFCGWCKYKYLRFLCVICTALHSRLCENIYLAKQSWDTPICFLTLHYQQCSCIPLHLSLRSVRTSTNSSLPNTTQLKTCLFSLTLLIIKKRRDHDWTQRNREFDIKSYRLNVHLLREYRWKNYGCSISHERVLEDVLYETQSKYRL